MHPDKVRPARNGVLEISNRQVSGKRASHTKQEAFNEAWSTTLSPNGQLIASCHGDRTLKLWDAKTGQRVQTLVHQHPIWACGFSPSGWGIATAGVDGMIWLWDLDANRCFGKLQGHTGWIHTLHFSPFEDIVASGSTDTTVRLWNIATGKCLAVFEGHDRPVYSVVFNPTGTMLASISDDQVLKIWDVQSGRCITTLYGLLSDSLTDVWAQIEAPLAPKG